MEGAAVTVATGVLGPALVMLGTLLRNDLLEGRREASDIKAIKSELEAVSPLLMRRPEAGDWTGEARELFYDIDDAVEDLMLDLGRSDSALAENRTNPFLNLRTKLREVTKRCRDKLEMTTPEANLSTHCKPEAVDPRARFLHSHRDASELVGMDEQRAKVVELLREDHEGADLKMVCIVGFAGTGKTTLADLVYHAIGEQFQCRAFASLSPGSTMADFLIAIVKQVTDSTTSIPFLQTLDHDYLVNYISNILAGKRYLIAVDDLWHPEDWEIIVKAFPENHMGSKIILTTTMNDVAVKFCTHAFFRQRNAFVHDIRRIDCYDAMKLLETVIIKGSETSTTGTLVVAECPRHSAKA